MLAGERGRERGERKRERKADCHATALLLHCGNETQVRVRESNVGRVREREGSMLLTPSGQIDSH